MLQQKNPWLSDEQARRYNHFLHNDIMSCSFTALIAVFQLKWITVATSQSKNTDWPFLSFRKDLLGKAPSLISFAWFVFSLFG